MSTDTGTSDLQTLKRSNTELKRALRHFIEAAPAHGSLAVQIENIRNALKSNQAMFTFASLVEQYVKMKKNFDNVDYQAQQRDLKTLKTSLKETLSSNISTEQKDVIEQILSDITNKEPLPSILAKAGQAIKTFGNSIADIRSDSNVVSQQNLKSDETHVVDTDILLASKKLLKNVSNVSNQLIQTYPNDKLIQEVIDETKKISKGKGTFFSSVNLLERTTTYLALLIQKERCSAQEMLHDIHASLMDAFKKSCVIEQLSGSSRVAYTELHADMAVQLKNLQSGSASIETIEGLQQHIKDNVSLMSNIMNEYANTQNEIHNINEAKIQELNAKIESTSSFVDKLEQQLNVAEESNLVDELTTVGNRKGYVARINKERNDWIAAKQTLSIIIVDVDHFKNINDNFGHSIGDQVLKSLGKTLQKCIRSTDYVARYGGEEFVIILPATDAELSVKIAKKLKETINSLKFEIRRKSKTLKITCSYGIASFSEKTEHTSEVFDLADRALFHAKNNGRNGIVLALDDELVVVKENENALN